MRILHAGCGGERLPDYFQKDAVEVRLDVTPEMKPDIVASITDMGEIGEFDALYCSHTVEHLYPHEVPKALAEFYRVLKPGGAAIIVVPDLEGLEVSDRVLYVTEAGLEVTAFDLFYGHRRLIENAPYMAHHSGFTQRLMSDSLKEAGFEPDVKRVDGWQLVAAARKPT